MVQRDACETNAPLNGASSQSGDGGSSAGFAENSHQITRDEGTLQRGTTRFSFFKWLRGTKNRDSSAKGERSADGKLVEEDRRRSIASSTESVGTFYSTATVRSFAFHSGTLGKCEGTSLDILGQAAEVGPFAAGATKFANDEENNGTSIASTLPANAHSRRKDITARYSLQPCSAYNSCGNLQTPRRNLSGSLRRLDDQGRISCGGSARRKFHVKGKRRAPNPPGVQLGTAGRIAESDARNTARNSNKRKRRPAPKPPEKVLEIPAAEKSDVKATDERGMDEAEQSISNDTLVLQGGVLLSKKEARRSPKANARGPITGETSGDCTPVLSTQEPHVQTAIGTLNTAMPRPWYKRSVFEHRDSGPSRRGDVLRSAALSSIEVKDDASGPGTMSSTNYSTESSMSRLSFFHRGDKQSEDKKREAKRRSGLSILTNISELDKEAAAIVQEEQARARASMLLKSSRFADALQAKNDDNEEIVQDIVTSAIDTSSPRRGTRALISKFNAISNITKVTVNANFFAKSGRDRVNPKVERDARASRFENCDDWPGPRRFPVEQGGHGVQIDKDISRYFLPQQRNFNKEGTKVEGKSRENKMVGKGDETERLTSETASRISFLQSQLAANRTKESSTCIVESANPITREKVITGSSVGGANDYKKFTIESEKPVEPISSRARFSRGLENKTEETASKQRARGLEVIQKEFADIFKEIDRHMAVRDSKDIEQRADKTNARKLLTDEAAASNKVSKVLDILVEAEKTRMPTTDRPTEPDKSNIVGETTPANDRDINSKPTKTKAMALNTAEDPITVDLKEMLKEMKHSLPKRPKPKKSAANHSDVIQVASARQDGSFQVSKPPYSPKYGMRKTEVGLLQNDYEMDKQKVSSSAQTSGNIRRLVQPSTRVFKMSELPSTSTKEPSISSKRSPVLLSKPSTSADRPSSSAQSSVTRVTLSNLPSTSSNLSFAERRQEDVSLKTSGKNAGTGLVKNTFQLIRPRDFAEIEATKTGKVCTENTYANVIEQSLYANAHVPSPKNSDNVQPIKNIRENEEKTLQPLIDNSKNKERTETEDNNLTDDEEPAKDRDMNTLAVNRLLRRLEAAISSGHHQQAAGLAKELARLKIHCSVVRQRSARLKDRLIKVNMYIEDKLAHQGPIPLQLPTRMTVAELKAKVHAEFEIPTTVQRWIIGKNLADHDGTTIDELQAVDGSPIFLYLVAPELQNEHVVETGKSATVEELPKVPVANAQAQKPQTNGRDEDETQVIVDVKEDERKTPEEVKMERYEELMSLENCDVIPNSEPIECPICFVTYGPREGVILRDCLHMFCRPCLANTILYCEEAEVKCPYRNTEYTCESTLQEREIKALVEPGVYQQHLAKSITQAENNAGNNAFHCKTPDCPGWCIYDDDVNNFLCPVCNVNNCLTCQAQHTGKNCRQYQEELRFSKETDQESRRTAAMLEEMVDRGEALPCPTCAVVLMKKWGCDWLRCSMCKTEICWVTKGPRWGPGGKGDTSGGCRCGENGVKCHPRCNYCH